MLSKIRDLRKPVSHAMQFFFLPLLSPLITHPTTFSIPSDILFCPSSLPHLNTGQIHLMQKMCS